MISSVRRLSTKCDDCICLLLILIGLSCSFPSLIDTLQQTPQNYLLQFQLVSFSVSHLHEHPVYFHIALNTIVILPVKLNVVEEIGVVVSPNDGINEFVVLFIQFLNLIHFRGRICMAAFPVFRSQLIQALPLAHLILFNDDVSAERTQVGHGKEETEILIMDATIRTHLRESSHKVQFVAVGVIAEDRHYVSHAIITPTPWLEGILLREAVVLGC